MWVQFPEWTGLCALTLNVEKRAILLLCAGKRQKRLLRSKWERGIECSKDMLPTCTARCTLVMTISASSSTIVSLLQLV